MSTQGKVIRSCINKDWFIPSKQISIQQVFAQTESLVLQFQQLCLELICVHVLDLKDMDMQEVLEKLRESVVRHGSLLNTIVSEQWQAWIVVQICQIDSQALYALFPEFFVFSGTLCQHVLNRMEMLEESLSRLFIRFLEDFNDVEPAEDSTRVYRNVLFDPRSTKYGNAMIERGQMVTEVARSSMAQDSKTI